MTQRKEEVTASFNTSNNSFIQSSHGWWGNEVLSSSMKDSNQSYQDFVLISEFSELEGPLPLAVVSNATYIDLKHYTEHPNIDPLKNELKKIGLDTFDFNAFVLRVVSVDRSSEYEQIDSEILMEPLTPSSIFADTAPNSIFSIPDDTQVYFTDSEHKFFAFTHHLTLFDINARGYVHPVALSYITRDPDKIVIRFEELMEKFNEVAIKMKKGNYSNFTLDLKRRLLDLQFTESTVSQQKKPVLSIQAIKQAITASQLMIDTLESSISQINQSEKMQSSTSSSSSSSSLSMQEKVSDHSPKDYTPQCIDTLYPVPHFEKKLRSLAQLCQEPNEIDEDDDDKKADLKKCHIKRPSLTQKTAKMIPLVFSIIGLQQQQPNEQNSEQQDEQDQQSESPRPTFASAIKHDMYSEAIESIQDMTQYFGKSSVILDVDEEERAFIDPVHSAITFGRTFMLNMDNPQPRVDEKEVETESKSETELDDKAEDKKEQHDRIEPNSSSTESDKDEISDEDLYYDIELAASRLWNSDRAPTHLLDVLKKYQSLIVDVIFSLMTGRTVLIQGSAHNKENVQEVVHALSVFVPGQRKDRHQIIDWFDQSRLTDVEIGRIKLVGIDKQNMDPSIHIEGSCVLDIDVKNGSLNSSPVYVEGQWINQLLDRILLFSSDESYLAYLHTVFMTMSLKAFIYHHLYVYDEFKVEDIPSTTSNNSIISRGYASETNSESSTVSRKWSVRLMSYLKKHEDQEHSSIQEKISRPPSRTSMTSTDSISKHSNITDNEEENYSDENQATVTLQNLMKHNNIEQKESKPRTIVGLFGSTSAGEPVTTTTNAVAKSISTISRRSSFDSSNSTRNLSDDEGSAVYNLKRPPMTTERSFLNFGAEDLDYFNGVQQDSSSDDSSLSEVEDEQEKSKLPRCSRRDIKYRSERLSDIGPDGVTYTERRGRRYLQEKLKVYGDDQTIVVYLATCVL